MAFDMTALSPEEARIAAGDETLWALLAEPVRVSRPETPLVPFVFASPHSGNVYPASFVQASRLDPLALRKSEDAFVDELFGFAASLGAPLLAARFPRVFVDANRAPSEIDASMFEGSMPLPVGARTARVAAGLGVIPRVVRDGVEIYRARLKPFEAAFRLNHFYRPYHEELARLIVAAQAKFGVAVLIDCHSMPAPARGGDIVLGDCFGESASPELSGTIHRLFHAQGFTVARNAPYAGGYSTRLHGRPDDGVHAVQIEISRALYLDETRMTKTIGFAPVQERLKGCGEALLSASGPWLLPRPPYRYRRGIGENNPFTQEKGRPETGRPSSREETPREGAAA